MAVGALGFALIFLLITEVVKGRNYTFWPDDVKIFTPCNNDPSSKLLDMSNLLTEYRDSGIYVEGYVTVAWEVEPTDRIELSCTVHKQNRGMWIPTLLDVRRSDLCATLYSPSEIWYEGIASTILKEERKCLNVRGHIFHVKSSDIRFVFNLNGPDVSGRYNATCHFTAYDENSTQRERQCLFIVGDIE